MIYSFKDRLQSIEVLYDNKDYSNVVIQTAKLVEVSLSYLFNHFHNTLKSKEDNLKYLEFERRNGEKYSQFQQKPTIGVSIGYLNQLLKYFPDHTRLNP